MGSQLLPVFLCGLALPIAMFMWLGHLAFSKFWTHPEYDEQSVIPPMRWFTSIVITLLLMLYGLKRKGVSRSGAVLGFIVGLLLALANHAYLACLVTFFLSSSRATKFRSSEKRTFEEEFKGGEGRRNWVQVLCNAGMPLQLSILYLIDCGSGERPIDFTTYYRSSWLSVGVMSSLACCNGDTWASEFGTVLSTGDPILITTGKRVPRGTNGGVSLIGLLVSLLGGVLIGLAYFITNVYAIDKDILDAATPQWPIIVFGGVAGLFGSLLDSVLGATIQFTGQSETGRIVSAPGEGVKHVSGIRVLDNHSVNLISSIVTGVLIPVAAFHFWPHN